MTSDAARLTGELLARCAFPPTGTTVTCGFSGGPDSSALLALAVAADLDVLAVHVHHGVRDSADDEAEAAERIAESLGVEFRCSRAGLDDGPNFEARARAARHTLLGPDALTGHTADDQAETVLLALLRGSGTSGLSAMRPGGRHPLLALRRHETRLLCDALHIDPVDDPTNTDPRFRRNRVRHELLPMINAIAERDVAPLLVRSAELLGDDDRLLDELAGTIDPTDAPALTAAPIPLARRAIRMWLSVDGYPPDAAAVARVLEVATGARSACEVTGVGRVRRSRQRLSVEPIASTPTHFHSEHPTG